jgi:hypothetical protein
MPSRTITWRSSRIPTHSLQADVHGVTVYGNDQGWEWRTECVHVFVQQGPDGDSKLPALEELAPQVVTESRDRLPAGTDLGMSLRAGLADAKDWSHGLRVSEGPAGEKSWSHGGALAIRVGLCSVAV